MITRVKCLKITCFSIHLLQHNMTSFPILSPSEGNEPQVSLAPHPTTLQYKLHPIYAIICWINYQLTLYIYIYHFFENLLYLLLMHTLCEICLNSEKNLILFINIIKLYSLPNNQSIYGILYFYSLSFVISRRVLSLGSIGQFIQNLNMTHVANFLAFRNLIKTSCNIG